MNLQNAIRGFLGGFAGGSPQPIRLPQRQNVAPQPTFGQRLVGALAHSVQQVPNLRTPIGPANRPTIGQAFQGATKTGNLGANMMGGKFFGIPQIDNLTNPVVQRVGQVPNTVFNYGKNQVVNPIVSGGKAVFDPKSTGMQRGLGAFQAGFGGFSATPPGVVFNTGLGAATSALEGARTKQNPLNFLSQNISNPSSIAREGLGIENPYVAMGVDLLLTRNPKNILKDPSGLKNAANLAKGGIKIIKNLRELRPIHTQDVSFMHEFNNIAMDAPKGIKPNEKMIQQARDVAAYYYGKKWQKAGAEELVNLFHNAIDRTATGKDLGGLKKIKMGLVDEQPQTLGKIQEAAESKGKAFLTEMNDALSRRDKPKALAALQKATPEYRASLEDMYRRTFNEAPTAPQPPSLGGPLPVNPPKKVGLLDLTFNRSRNVIAKQGESGKKLAGKLKESRDIAETSAGNWVSQLPTVRKLSKEEFTNFVDVAEGKGQPLSPLVERAAKEWNGVREQVYQSAKGSGLDIGRQEQYFPHVFDDKLFSDKNRYNEAINHLVESGQAKTQEEAVALLARAQDIVRNRRQGNLELERLVDLPGYEKTPDALFGYLESAANRIGQASSFGAKDEQALKLITGIAREGGDAETAKNLFDVAAGAKKNGETVSRVTGTLRKTNSLTKLGLGAITNVGQSVNTATVTGAVRTMLNAPKAAFSKESKDFALKAGVTLDGVLRDIKEGGGFSGKVLGKLTAPGFNKVEKFNRTLAAVAGRDYAMNLASKAAKGDRGALRALDKLGLDSKGIVSRGGKLSEQEQIAAARSIVERTQFKVDPQDLPGWASSPWGKVIAQFRTFSYNQSAFIKREIWDEATKGNVAPLVRFLAIGLPVGAAIKETRNVLQNRKSEENPAKRVTDYYTQVGGLGLAGDAYKAFFPQGSGYLSPERRATMATGFLGGPTVGTGLDLFTSTVKATQGKPEDLERFALRQIPVAGTTLQNTFVPYKNKAGETNQRFTFGADKADAAGPETTAAPTPTTTTPPTGGVSRLDELKIREQVSQLEAQEKAIYGDDPTNVFGFKFGGLSDKEKEQKLAELETQKAQLKAPLDKPTGVQGAEYSLESDRALRNEDYDSWQQLTDTYIKQLAAYQQTLDPNLDKQEYLSIQNKIEDLVTKSLKYQSNGGAFKAPKKGKKLSLKSSKPRKTSKLVLKLPKQNKGASLVLKNAPLVQSRRLDPLTFKK
jgi:hypothetical protein